MGQRTFPRHHHSLPPKTPESRLFSKTLAWLRQAGGRRPRVRHLWAQASRRTTPVPPLRYHVALSESIKVGDGGRRSG